MYIRKYLKIILFTFVFLLSAALPTATAEAKRIDINYGDGDWCGYENEDGTLTKLPGSVFIMKITRSIFLTIRTLLRL